LTTLSAQYLHILSCTRTVAFLDLEASSLPSDAQDVVVKMPSPQTTTLLLFLSYGVTSVTIIPASPYPPKRYWPLSDPVSSDLELFLQSYPKIGSNKPKIVEFNATHLSSAIRSQPITKNSGIYPSQDSFVRGAIDAWARNQHFVIRPENVWFTILGQLNLYLSNHQDNNEVRDKIEYQKKITFDSRRYWSTDDYEDGEYKYNTFKILDWETRGRFKTSATYSWLQPNFSTSKPYEDAIIANLLLTGPVDSSSVGDPFPSSTHSPGLGAQSSSPPCGMPSITLMGTQKDWQQLLLKLERIPDFGSQPAEYSTIIRPILSRFVTSFDQPNGQDIRQFWDAIVTGGGGGEGKGCLGESVVAGWINGFHYWDAYGRLLSRGGESKGFSLDGVVYPSRSINDMPHTFTSTPLQSRVNILGYIYINLGDLAAGMVGKKITNGAPESYATAIQRANFTLPSTITKEHHSMLEPFSRWLLIGKPCVAVSGACN
jgi:Domain of unknown function (DUF4419)